MPYLLPIFTQKSKTFIICDIFVSPLWNPENALFRDVPKWWNLIKYLTMSTKQGIFYNYWIDLVTLNKFDFIKSSENWGKKCLLGLTNIWSNRGHCVRLSWKFILHAKNSLSQHFRTTFKSDLTYKFLPLRVIYFFPTWGGWPCRLYECF